MGGDHFVILRRIEGEEVILQDDDNIIDSVRNYFINHGNDTRVQVCGGVYVLTSNDYKQIDVDHMIDCARVAERRIRHSRHDGYEFYNHDQWEKGKRAAVLINHLPDAIKDGEIQVWYQPQVNSKTNEITGAEALCRWKHPTLGWVSPGEFIPIMEEAGLISDLDFYVWETVCKDLQRWNEQGKHQVVSVNLSRCDITEDRNIPDLFKKLIDKYEIKPDQLRVEITETGYVESPDILIKTTERLKKYGFQVEMDDFGSGYSSLNMLKDRIKLDLHFLRKSDYPEKSRTIISYIVQMVHSLGMDMIAEGVETDEQSRFLQSKGCSEMQGYYFYKPMNVTDFEKISAHAGTGSTRL